MKPAKHILDAIEKAQMEFNAASIEYHAAKARLKTAKYTAQIHCSHERGYPTYHQGDTGFYCPDCGYET